MIGEITVKTRNSLRWYRAKSIPEMSFPVFKSKKVAGEAATFPN
jgi:hypothetical protein